MISVTDVATHLLTLLQPSAAEASDDSVGIANGKRFIQPQRSVTASQPGDVARLAFYHYLKNLCEPGELLTTHLLDRFYRRALSHQHWATNKEPLFNEINACLQHFSNERAVAIPMAPYHEASSIQILEAESFKSLIKVVEDWARLNTSPSDQVRIISDRDERLLLLRLSPDRNLSVFIFDRRLCLRDGILEPLTDDLVVHYNSQLALDLLQPSLFTVGPHTIVKIRPQALSPTQTVSGSVVRGFTFQRQQELVDAELSKQALLLYPLKRIEQFFIRKDSDPLYIELSALLEKGADLLSHHHPDGIRFAEAAVERGRLAYDQVFEGDRLLRILLENLERALKLAKLKLEPSFSEKSREILSEASSAGFENGELIDLLANPSTLAPQAKVFFEDGPTLKYGQLSDDHQFIEHTDQRSRNPVDLLDHQEGEQCEVIQPINALRGPARKDAPHK